MTSVHLLIAFDLISARDGSMHTVQAWSEALDAGDKGTAKAMSSAFKCAMLEVFCVPDAREDTDACSARTTRRPVETEPPQGWPAWAEDITAMIDGCASGDALDLIRTRQSALLEALRRERSELYHSIGGRFAKRMADLKSASNSNMGELSAKMVKAKEELDA